MAATPQGPPHRWRSDHPALAPAPFEVAAEGLAGGVRVLRVAGEIDMQTTARLAAALDAEIARSGAALVVDLTGVTFLSAAGISVLARADQRAARSAIRLRLAGPRPIVHRALTLTGMTRQLPCDDTLAAALQALT